MQVTLGQEDVVQLGPSSDVSHCNPPGRTGYLDVQVLSSGRLLFDLNIGYPTDDAQGGVDLTVDREVLGAADDRLNIEAR